MIAIMRMARWQTLKLLGMAGPLYACLVVAGYEVQGRCCKLTLDARRRFCREQLFVSFGIRFLAAVWRSIRRVLDLLFEASADVGEWFAGLLGLNLEDLQSLPRSRTS